jgi:site-specific DNA-methyltransferase (adenine-specific)
LDRWLNQIICGDCLEVMKDMPDKSVDLVVTDPPYNASNSKIVFTEKQFNAVNEEWDKKFEIEPFIEETVRVLKSNGSLLVFCSYHLLGEYLTKTPLKL